MENNDKAPRRFKYLREDFGELPVTLEHLSMYINFKGAEVEAENCLQMSAARPLDRLELDAKALEIESVESVGEPEDISGSPLEFEYLRDKDKLIVKLPRRIEKGERFFVRTRTVCVPSEHILEGIYKDTTPPGAPQQFISQCQQWGFQRIMPIFDDCRAKCTMTTTIEADSAYTHLVSNGNVSRRHNPDGTPVPKKGDAARKVITYENPVPMAPYLFFVAAGTWDTLTDEVAFPSGRKARLEYLVPPGSAEEARIPMSILKDSVLWLERTQGYEYAFEAYRTICMNKSNFGGMENLGNTTIVTDAALITPHTLDGMLLYAHAVIVHEFEHNQCGSETTMETPFDVWLNEAYTVDVERQFMADLFDPAFVRLYQVESIRAPLLGPLTIEDAGHFGRIVREGFNDPDELIDGVTYVKAAEVIRMLRLIIGREAFHAGKTLYFSRYKGANANTDQFFECFEEVSGTSLEQFKGEWLYRIGYPKVVATTENNGDSFRIRFSQERQEGRRPFYLPIELALVDRDGKEIEDTQRTFILKDFEAECVFDSLPRPAVFASMNRGYSFYGTFRHANADAGTLAMQARFDPDAYNRVDAMRKLTDIERLKLLEDPKAHIDEKWLSVYGSFLADENLPPSLKSYFLRIDEQPMDRTYATWYPELVAAKERLMLAVNKRYRGELLKALGALDKAGRTEETMREGIERRMLKSVLFELVAIDDTPESHSLIIESFDKAATATERVTALAALNRSTSPARREMIEAAYVDWHRHLSGYANYLRIVSGGTGTDVFDRIEFEKSRPSFDMNQPTWCRALFLTMAGNNKMVWTDRGIEWVADTVVMLSRINTTTAGRLLNTFQHVRSLKPGLKEKVMAALEKIVRLVPEESCPPINGQASAYLKGAGK